MVTEARLLMLVIDFRELSAKDSARKPGVGDIGPVATMMIRLAHVETLKSHTTQRL